MICLDYQPLAIRQMSDAYTIDGLQQHAVILKIFLKHHQYVYSTIQQCTELLQ